MGDPVKFDVVGMNHRVLLTARRRMATLTEKKSLRCDLEREPKNQYDKNAIKVVLVDRRFDPRLNWETRFHIGYIRRETAKVLAHGLDSGNLRVKACRLVYVNADHGWGSVRVSFLKTPVTKPIISP
jgi:hypothetical protein